VDQLGLGPLARARGEDAFRDELDARGQVDELRVAWLDRALLLFELEQRLDIAQEGVGRAAQGVTGPRYRRPSLLLAATTRVAGTG
jgi:hypothetical protein